MKRSKLSCFFAVLHTDLSHPTWKVCKIYYLKILKGLEMLEVLNPSVKRLLWKNHSGWHGVTSSHTDTAFSIPLRTDHQARLTEIVKILAELNIIPVLLIPSTGQLKTKASHATTGVYSKGSAKPQMIFRGWFYEIRFFISLELHYTWHILADCLVQNINWPFCNTRRKLKEKKSMWKCGVIHPTKHLV